MTDKISETNERRYKGWCEWADRLDQEGALFHIFKDNAAFERGVNDRVYTMYVKYRENRSDGLLATISRESILQLPNSSGIYIVTECHSSEKVIYVGKARRLRSRWSDHHRANEIAHYALTSFPAYQYNIASFSLYFLPDSCCVYGEEREITEFILIKKLKPLLNNTSQRQPCDFVDHRHREYHIKSSRNYAANFYSTMPARYLEHLKEHRRLYPDDWEYCDPLIEEQKRKLGLLPLIDESRIAGKKARVGRAT